MKTYFTQHYAFCTQHLRHIDPHKNALFSGFFSCSLYMHDAT